MDIEENDLNISFDFLQTQQQKFMQAISQFKPQGEQKICFFCENSSSNVVKFALTQKYQHEYLKFSQALEQNLCQKIVEKMAKKQTNQVLKQSVFLHENKQFLKCFHASPQSSQQLNIVTEFYRFHQSVPLIPEKSVEPFLSKYYNQKREELYQRIERQSIKKQKQAEKKKTPEQLHSLPSNSKLKVPKNYSKILPLLKASNDSEVLQKICSDLDKNKSINNNSSLKLQGQFESNKIFKKFLKKEKEKSLRKNDKKSKQKQQVSSPSKNLKDLKILNKFNNTQLLKVKTHVDYAEQIAFTFKGNIKIKVRNAKYYPENCEVQEEENDFQNSTLNFHKTLKRSEKLAQFHPSMPKRKMSSQHVMRIKSTKKIIPQQNPYEKSNLEYQRRKQTNQEKKLHKQVSQYQAKLKTKFKSQFKNWCKTHNQEAKKKEKEV